MHISQVNKIRILLTHSDIEMVQMGLELIASLDPTDTQILDAMGYTAPLSTVEHLEAHFVDLPHGRIVFGWLILKLIEMHNPWVRTCTHLNLTRCGIETLPDAIATLSGLESLDLSFNQLSTISDIIPLGHIQNLKLQGNPLSLNELLTSFSSNTVNVEGLIISTVDVTAGTFTMGALEGDDDARSDKLRFSVHLSHPFQVMAYPVTQALYEWVMHTNPSAHKAPSHPVTVVNWHSAVQFANALSLKFGFTPAYEIDGWAVTCAFETNGWRLPTEAEWEYCARGGEALLYAGSNDPTDVAWFQENSAGRTHPVGKKKPNGFGLHDMSGNVAEWCWDWWVAQRSAETVHNPKGPIRGHYRMIKGGHWSSHRSNIRCSSRINQDPKGFRYKNLGFRLVRTKTLF